LGRELTRLRAVGHRWQSGNPAAHRPRPSRQGPGYNPDIIKPDQPIYAKID